MDTKQTTKTFPRLVMKEWPHVYIDKGVVYVNGVSEKALSDFTRVVEETGVLQKETQRRKRASDHDAGV